MKKYIIHTGPGIGDMMQFFSMARAIKEQEPDARVDFLMRGSPKFYSIDSQLFKCQDYADNLYWYSFESFFHTIFLIIRLFFIRYDYGFSRSGSVTGHESIWPYKIMRFACCKTIVGYGIPEADYNIDNSFPIHYLERNALMLEAIKIKPRSNAVALNPNKIDNYFLNTLNIPDGKKVIGLSVGTNTMKWTENGVSTIYDVKSWPYFKWIELATRLSNDYYVILIGGKKEMDEMNEQGVILKNSNNLINLVGKTSLQQSLAIVNRCDLVVGSEGGMMHTASAFGTLTLTIIGGSDYVQWNPGGINSPYIKVECDRYPCFGTRIGAFCNNHNCLNSITVDMVFEKLLNLLSH